MNGTPKDARERSSEYYALPTATAGLQNQDSASFETMAVDLEEV